METLVVIIFFFRKNIGHALPCRSSSSHALNYSLLPMCGTASIRVHQPCTKLLHSRVPNCTVDYPDRSAAVMPNEPSNHKTPLLSSSKLDGRSNHHFTLLSQLPLSPTLASASSGSSFLQENPDLLLPLFFSPKEGKVSASMVLILAKPGLATPRLIL